MDTDNIRSICEEFEQQITNLICEIAKLKEERTKLLAKIKKLNQPIPKGKVSIHKLKQALRRAITNHGHDYHCSAARGMESDCHCGWITIKKLAGL